MTRRTRGTKCGLHGGRTEAVLVLETILGSDAGTNDPVGVALNEAVADGAWRSGG